MPITQSLNSKANVKKSTNQDLPFSQQQSVISSHYAVSTAGQTVINLSFSVDTVNLSDQFFLFVDGKKLTLGSSNDYTFTSIGSNGYSTQVTLTPALTINLNIQAYMLGLKREVEFNMDNRFIQLYAAEGSGFQGFVDQTSFINTATTTVGTPAAGTFYSSIISRAPMVDLSQNLKAQMGIERIMAQQIQQIQTEFGPNGESVWATPNDIFGQIRFAGTGWTTYQTSNGVGTFTSIIGDFVEITFYGTGLSVVGFSNGASWTSNITVDGVSSGTFTQNTVSSSGVLNGRNTSPNIIQAVVAGLSLGIHTIKLALTVGSLNFSGAEILNESSLVKVNPGVGYTQAQKYTSSALQTFAYNSVATGTRGGRVVAHQKGDGTIGTAWQAVNGASATLTSADHTNEEPVRTYHWREFGANRTDDYSTLIGTPSSRAFTLDDGTTSLAGLNNRNTVPAAGAPDCLSLGGTFGNFYVFTFVGTGLDIVITADAGGTNGSASAHTVAIDGGSPINLSTVSPGTAILNTLKIVSGLPYGTHTVRIQENTVSAWNLLTKHFIVYQPKKPSIPSGSVELADYNVTATFAPNTTQGQDTVAAGTLWKSSTREFTFVGAGWSVADSTSHATGFNVVTSTNGDYLEYTFFGTGIDLKTFTGGADSASVQVDFQNLTSGGSLLNATTTNFPTLLGSAYGGSFSTGTGIADFSGASAQMGIGAYNLPLALYKVRLTNGTANLFQFSCINPIVPIHASKSNIYADLQNTLPVGSNCISDNRKITPVKETLPNQKSWSQAQGITSGPTTTSTSLVPMPDMSVTVKSSGGTLKITYSVSFSNSFATATCTAQAYLNGIAIGSPRTLSSSTAGATTVANDTIKVPVAAGVHKVDVYWSVSSNTGTLQDTQRDLLAEET